MPRKSRDPRQISLGSGIVLVLSTVPISAIGLRSSADVKSSAVLTSWTRLVESSTAAASLNSGVRTVLGPDYCAAPLADERRSIGHNAKGRGAKCPN